MDALLTLIVGWPTGVYTVLLGVVVLYWLMALVGVVNFDHGHLHIDAHHEVPNHSGGEHLSTIAGYVVAFGLSGVPFSIVISLVTLIAWVITGLISQYLLSWVPGYFIGLDERIKGARRPTVKPAPQGSPSPPRDAA